MLLNLDSAKKKKKKKKTEHLVVEYNFHMQSKYFAISVIKVVTKVVRQKFVFQTSHFSAYLKQGVSQYLLANICLKIS
jgi:hypothetical protein